MGGWLDSELSYVGVKPMQKAAPVIGQAIAAAKAKAETPPSDGSAQPPAPPAVACKSVTNNAVHCAPTVGPRNNNTTIVIRTNEPAAYVPGGLVTDDPATNARFVDSALTASGYQRDGKGERDGKTRFYRVPVKYVSVDEAVAAAQGEQPVQPGQGAEAYIPETPGAICVSYSDPDQVPDCAILPDESAKK